MLESGGLRHGKPLHFGQKNGGVASVDAFASAGFAHRVLVDLCGVTDDVKTGIFKVANYALVPQVPFPMHYTDGLKLFIVGLTNDPKRLSVVRKTRQIAQSDEGNTSYTDLELISGEVRDARRLFARNKWPVIDITRRSVEETAAAVIQLYTSWKEEQS